MKIEDTNTKQKQKVNQKFLKMIDRLSNKKSKLNNEDDNKDIQQIKNYTTTHKRSHSNLFNFKNTTNTANNTHTHQTVEQNQSSKITYSTLFNKLGSTMHKKSISFKIYPLIPKSNDYTKYSTNFLNKDEYISACKKVNTYLEIKDNLRQLIKNSSCPLLN